MYITAPSYDTLYTSAVRAAGLVDHLSCRLDSGSIPALGTQIFKTLHYYDKGILVEVGNLDF